jgi:tetratricopeptide (TPR) repeat protein
MTRSTHLLSRSLLLLVISAAGCSKSEPAKEVVVPVLVSTHQDPEPTKLEGALAAAPDGLADVLYLSPDSVIPYVHDNEDICRQLARQALWLAAHDEFGLRVPDAVLGEPVPEGLPEDRMVRITYDPKSQNAYRQWRVLVGAKNERLVWDGQKPNEVHFLVPLPVKAVETAEEISRGLLVKCLAAARFTPKPNKRSAAPVPAAAEELLKPMRETSQFAAVRMLHDEIRGKGESDALVGALARGYANLGLLTEFHWTPAPYAFKARSLLYAQRLVARSPKSPLARWHRAYAAALSGLHKLALLDLDEAAKLAKADPAAKPPAWVDLIDAYLHFDLRRLAAIREGTDTPLARLLDYLAREEPGTPLATIRAGRKYLADNPECYRVHDSLCRTGGVSNMHQATTAGPAAFDAHFLRRVAGQPGLPKSVAKLLDQGNVNEAAVYAALRRAGTPSADRGSLSWAVLAGLLQEVRFTQAWRRLYFMGRQWSVPTDEAAGAALPALEGHPRRSLVEALTLDPRKDPAAFRRKMLAAPMDGTDLRADGYSRWLRQVDPAAGGRAWGLACGRNHGTYYGLCLYLHHTYSASSSGAYGEMLAELNPHAPLAVALTAALGSGRKPPTAADRLPDLEKRYAGHAVVQRWVGRRYFTDGRTADAIRCWERWIELSPDGQAYLDLAEAYDAQGDEEHWRQTLEASLKQEDTGLNHARANVALANKYMAKGQYDKAEPYGMAAAGSYAAFGLLCAAQCEEGLGKYDEANKIYRAATERYDTCAFQWYFACRNSGHMDTASAERAVRALLASAGKNVPEDWSFSLGRYYLLTGRPREALAALTRPISAKSRLTHLLDGGAHPNTVLFIALLAEETGDTALRNRALKRVGELPGGHVHLKTLAASIRTWVEAGGVPDEAAIKGTVIQPSASQQADCEFFAGWFLANRGQADRAAELWRRGLGKPAGTRWLQTHARAFLAGREKAAKPTH